MFNSMSMCTGDASRPESREAGGTDEEGRGEARRRLRHARAEPYHDGQYAGCARAEPEARADEERDADACLCCRVRRRVPGPLPAAAAAVRVLRAAARVRPGRVHAGLQAADGGPRAPAAAATARPRPRAPVRAAPRYVPNRLAAIFCLKFLVFVVNWLDQEGAPLHGDPGPPIRP